VRQALAAIAIHLDLIADRGARLPAAIDTGPNVTS